MTDMLDNEETLRRQFQELSKSELPEVDKVINATVQQANVQTGARDLLILAISSFFAVLLVLCTPLAASMAKIKRHSREPDIGKLVIKNNEIDRDL